MPLNINEYKSQVERHEHAKTIVAVVAISAIFVPLGISVAVRMVNEMLAYFVAPVSLLVFGFPLMLYGFWRLDRLYKRFPMLVCVRCKGSIARASSTVIATGNCPNCGRRVLTDDTIGT